MRSGQRLGEAGYELMAGAGENGSRSCRDWYPIESAVDDWCARLLERAEGIEYEARVLDDHGYSQALGVHPVAGASYVVFEGESFDTFYGYWQPRHGSGQAPLLVHLPPYNPAIRAHPQFVAAGFNVLHVSPLGYVTPKGSRLESCPVLPDTITSFGACGYVGWLRDVLVAVRWARMRPEVTADRIGCFGTSGGGGGALLVGSLLRDDGCRAVAADLPFLTDFRSMVNAQDPGAYRIARDALRDVERSSPERLCDAWRAVGFVDTLSHVHRLCMPTLLVGATEDDTTPAGTVRALFERLSGTRSYTELAGQEHSYTVPFLHLAASWFRLYV